jgi:hypothetical protein
LSLDIRMGFNSATIYKDSIGNSQKFSSSELTRAIKYER